MKRIAFATAFFCTAAMIGVSIFPPSTLFVWNRTESAPKGLYWLSDKPLILNGWAVVSGNARAAIWISKNGYLGRGWLIIKRVRGLVGDEVCRIEETILINGKAAATALKTDSSGKKLPNWQGCFVVSKREVFLLNDHPRSLDGRYFGATNIEDVTGAARLLIEVP